MEMKMAMVREVATDQLDMVFGALADPTRRAILTRLQQGEASVSELAAPFRVSQPAISRHLKVLEHAGLISRTRRATARLSHLRAEPLRQATVWLAGYRDYWEQSYERLEELLAELQHDEADRSRPSDPTGRGTT
jgi:DNA-binding transcriptional ArsR family regulator